ncbi:hypothetical protein ACRTC7_22455 [Vibrio fluvialis]|uniref:hypothetical protein n=1 Tax=Vibrio fluvialis TaxID=676 RepID=UPI001C9C7F3C|nr:hypothetical protein [Vibrio fluvialis]MBY8105346.1 hypothetical protein [Vibrio fluvialis]
MKTYIIIILSSVSVISLMFGKIQAQEAELSEKDNIIREQNTAIKAEQLTTSVLEQQLETVKAELAEIQTLRDSYAQRAALLENELNTQNEILNATRANEQMHVQALTEILRINEVHKACIVNNLAQGTVASDGSRTVIAGQSACFEEYRSSVNNIALTYGAGDNV